MSDLCSCDLGIYNTIVDVLHMFVVCVPSHSNLIAIFFKRVLSSVFSFMYALLFSCNYALTDLLLIITHAWGISSVYEPACL